MAYGFNDDKSKFPVSFKAIEVEGPTFTVSGASGSWTVVPTVFEVPQGYVPIGVSRKFQLGSTEEGLIDLGEDRVKFFELSYGTTRTVHPIAIVYLIRSDMIES